MNKVQVFEFKNEGIEDLYNKRYKLRDETIHDMFERVSNFLGSDSRHSAAIYEAFEGGRFYGAGRVMTSADSGFELTMNNCFISNFVPDSMDGIFESVKLNAKVHQKNGGNGNEFSMIRPAGTPTSNTAIASGPVPFMNCFNEQTKTVAIGARSGANMGCLSIYHPDIIAFATAKSIDPEALTQFNMSVVTDDLFMKAVENDEEITLRWPVYDHLGRYTEEKDWKVKKVVKAKEIWDVIMTCAYNYGEPGILFYDNLNKYNNIQYVETIICTNPCGEAIGGILDAVGLIEAKGCCNLGSLYLHKYVIDPFTKLSRINYELLRKDVRTAIRMLDNVIDKNYYPTKDFENYQMSTRTIGLGTTGLATMLQMLELKYGSPESLRAIDYLYNEIAKEAYRASIELAKEEGRPFPLYDKKFLKSGFLAAHDDEEWKIIKKDIATYGIRNARLISVAPSGTTSMIFGQNCSSGIEPVFSFEYDREIKDAFGDKKKVKMYDYGYGLCKELYPLTNRHNFKPEYFIGALDLTVDDHLNVLERVVKHVDAAVSKTINVPTECSFEDAKHIYSRAWKFGCKGITIFRPNDLRPGIFSTESDKKVEKIEMIEVIEESSNLKRGDLESTSEMLVGKKVKIKTGCGSLHVSGFFTSDGELKEIFLAKGGSGGCNSYMSAVSRMTSLALRAGVKFEEILDQLKSVTACPSYVVRTKTKGDTSPGSSCSSGIANALEKMSKEFDITKIAIIEANKELICLDCDVIPNKEIQKEKPAEFKVEKNDESEFYEKCPDCGEKSPKVSSCFSCNQCGYSKCS